MYKISQKINLAILIIMSIDCLYLRSEAFDLKEFNSLALEGVLDSKTEICDSALIKLEILQNQAISEKNFVCQTYSLGLGADLVMSKQKLDRGDSALRMLKKVNELCKGM